VNDPCILAEATMTLALPKIGMKEKSAKVQMGDLYLADIGVPPKLYEEIGIELDDTIFFDYDVIQLW
jgi:NAD(P)H-hydrate epimerase